MNDEISRLEPAWIKKALISSIKEQERIRAKYIVEKHRALALEQPVNTEIPSNPITSRPDFSKTSHHRDYAAVRCISKKIILIHLDEMKENRKDPVLDAFREQSRAKADLDLKIKQTHEAAVTAKNRYQDAINKVALEQVITKLISEKADYYQRAQSAEH
jgi:hypothetical protein